MSIARASSLGAAWTTIGDLLSVLGGCCSVSLSNHAVFPYLIILTTNHDTKTRTAFFSRSIRIYLTLPRKMSYCPAGTG